jgi:hypothetical protein
MQKTEILANSLIARFSKQRDDTDDDDTDDDDVLVFVLRVFDMTVQHAHWM